MKLEFKRVDTSTVKGIIQAEALQKKGWKPVDINPVTDWILMERKIKPKNTKS